MSDSDYGVGARLLHRLALNSKLIAQASFDLESTLTKSLQSNLYNKPQDDSPVFISGLARAGTTVLMRALHATGQFRSLTYRDMPFVLMPNVWKKISSRSREDAPEKERAHGDRILVNFDSPEAFDEVFWRTFCGNDYIFDNCLRPHEVGDEVIDKFRLFVRHALVSSDLPSQARYLSKNNNNILRLPYIRSAFPKSTIIIPFRNPVQHAFSLMNQHQRFCETHAKDGFTFNYMKWLGHHEFGLTHKPFRFDVASNTNIDKFDTGDVNYWMTLWMSTYQHLLNTAPYDCIFVCYEELCVKPAYTLRKIYEKAAIESDGTYKNTTFNLSPAKEVSGIDSSVGEQCHSVYEKLVSMSPKC